MWPALVRIAFGRELYIEREDFMETPPPKYVRQRAKYWKLTELGAQRMAHRTRPPEKQ